MLCPMHSLPFSVDQQQCCCSPRFYSNYNCFCNFQTEIRILTSAQSVIALENGSAEAHPGEVVVGNGDEAGVIDKALCAIFGKNKQIHGRLQTHTVKGRFHIGLHLR